MTVMETTTCFGLYWPSSGCLGNLKASYMNARARGVAIIQGHGHSGFIKGDNFLEKRNDFQPVPWNWQGGSFSNMTPTEF